MSELKDLTKGTRVRVRQDSDAWDFRKGQTGTIRDTPRPTADYVSVDIDGESWVLFTPDCLDIIAAAAPSRKERLDNIRYMLKRGMGFSHAEVLDILEGLELLETKEGIA